MKNTRFAKLLAPAWRKSPTCCNVFLLLTAFALLSHTSFARRVYSQASGNWATASTWANSLVPASNDTVFIYSNHTVVMDSQPYSGNSTNMFLIIYGTLDVSNNGRLRLSSTSKVVIETGGRLVGNASGSDMVDIGGGSSEYTGNMGTINGPSYIGNGHTPVSGEGTSGCGCSTVGTCRIVSSNGYVVNISLIALNIVPHTSPCTYGYNYDVRLSYNITFSGTNIPSSLWTLQGNVYCGTSGLFFDLPNSGGSGTVTTGGNAWRGVSDCATATPRSLNCASSTIEIQGPGITTTTCNAILPIKLMNFYSDATQKGINLTWNTSLEQNFDYFLLERAGSDLNFHTISQLDGKGAGEVNTGYSYLDENPLVGKNYYRLKSVDLDGSYEYSNVISETWQFKMAEGVKLYPNPTDHQRGFTIELDDDLGTSVSMLLIDSFGKTLLAETIYEQSATVQLPDDIVPGIYLVKLNTLKGQRVLRVSVKN